MGVRQIQSLSGPLDVALPAPGSKSVTHRALVAAALADGESTIRNPLDADDTRVTLEGLRGLGFRIDAGAERWTVAGGGGRVPGGGNLELRESGTSLRFLLAVAALGEAPSRLDGAPRLRERPIAELVTALRGLGAEVRADGPGEASLPLIAGGKPLRGGRVRLDGRDSSQYASALLLAAPRIPGGLELRLGPGAVSMPYVELTAEVLRAFGCRVERPETSCWRVATGGPGGVEYRVEGDHSSASYFLAAAAVVGGSVRVDGLRPDSAQPDAGLAALLGRLGCRVRRGADWIRVTGTGRIHPFDHDARESPDLVPTLAVLALFTGGRCRLTGVAHLRLKESDRLAVLAENLRALGREAVAGPDELVVEPPVRRPHGGLIRTAGDHRIAMAFAVAGLRVPGVAIDDAACVAKSNPAFWSRFALLEGRGS